MASGKSGGTLRAVQFPPAKLACLDFAGLAQSFDGKPKSGGDLGNGNAPAGLLRAAVFANQSGANS